MACGLTTQPAALEPPAGMLPQLLCVCHMDDVASHGPCVCRQADTTAVVRGFADGWKYPFWIWSRLPTLWMLISCASVLQANRRSCRAWRRWRRRSTSAASRTRPPACFPASSGEPLFASERDVEFISQFGQLFWLGGMTDCHACSWIVHSALSRSLARRGHSFLKVNEELLDIYAACDTSVDVIAAQAAHMEHMRAGQEQNAARKSAFRGRFSLCLHLSTLPGESCHADGLCISGVSASRPARCLCILKSCAAV